MKMEELTLNYKQRNEFNCLDCIHSHFCPFKDKICFRFSHYLYRRECIVIYGIDKGVYQKYSRGKV